MKIYDFFALIIIPMTLFRVALDFLSDKEIINNEIKAFIIIFIHHFLGSIQCITIFLLFIDIGNEFSMRLFLLINLIISLISQIGWIVNNDLCFLTKYQNYIINKKKPNRKWRGGIDMYIKHYIRGDEWAYANPYKLDFTSVAFSMNMTLLIYSLKKIIFK
jgi:hypothetical protein